MASRNYNGKVLMKIKELAQELTTLSDDDREKYLASLVKKLTPMSFKTIFEVQRAWDFENNPPPEGMARFFAAQNKAILACILLEQSIAGTEIRKQLGMPPLLDEDEL